MPTLTSSSNAVGVGRFNTGSGGNRPNRMSKTPFIPVSIEDHSIQTGAKEVLRVVRPQWMTKNGMSNIKSKVFTEGLSNKLVGFFVEDNKEDIVIVKVFGTNTDHMIDRQAEIETMKILHDRKCGAELYATFSNGICYQYMNGMTLEAEDCQDPKIYRLLAAEMARMHSGIGKGDLISDENGLAPEQKDKLNGSDDDGGTTGIASNNNQNGQYNYHQHNSRQKVSQIWSKLRQFNKLAEGIMATDPEFRETLKKIGITVGWGARAISELESILGSHTDIPITFCHNDLLPRNIVFDNKSGRITFIDVEYAMYNYAPFDVANHFLEFAGVDQIDYTKYPEESFRHQWLQEYLKHLKLDQSYPDEITVEKFDAWVELCVPMSHLLWGLWGIYQAKHSTIEFDYVGYVQLRLSEFQKHMGNLRKLSGDSKLKTQSS